MKEISASCFLVFSLLPFVFSLNWQDGSPNARWSMGCDFFGNDLTNVKINGENCGQKCSENPSCTHFTWTNYEGGTCWLKRGPVNEGNARVKNDEGAVCGYLKGRNTQGGGGSDWQDGSPNARWSMGCDFFGNDLTNVKINGENCGQKCSENPSCTHFTWTNYEGGTCWLKRGPVNEGNARVINDEGAVCGYLKGRNTQGGGGSGDCVSTQSENCIKIVNKCQQTIYVGTFGRPSKPAGGGFKLEPNGEKIVKVEPNWEGRFWGRTGCFENNGRCSTGDCGGRKAECEGRTGEPPATLAEIKFRGAGNQDFYDVSNVDGYNLPMKFGPIPGTIGDNAGGYRCTEANCLNNAILNECPQNLAVRDNSGKVVGCKSECAAHNNPEYCCTPPFNSPNTCKASDYARKVKAKCPLAYSYAYDDQKSTFTCKGNSAPSPAYMVTFCG